MNEKQVKLNEFMIAFEKKIPPNTNFCHYSEYHICEETSRGIGACSILKLASPLSMHNAARVKHFI